MKRTWLIVFCLFVFTKCVVSNKKKRDAHVFTDGDVIIGGLSPVHFSPIDESTIDPDDSSCQGELNTRGYEAVEAMLFTMDMLNHGHLKDSILPNITIGMDIKETCTTADNAIRESLKFSFIQNENMEEQCSGEKDNKVRKAKTVAVVGAAYSGVSMAVTNLCGLFYVPLVSYASTSRLLSNKVQFRYFFRTVPSDMLQAQVMVDLVKAMDWNYVVTLASDTEYGRSGIDAFKDAAQRLHDYHICIPVDETFTKMSEEKTFDSIFKKMMAHPKAKVIILFAELHDAQILFDKIRERKMEQKYIWIGSDAWADSKDILKSNEAILNGMFAIVPEVRKIEKFVQYFVDFNEKRRLRNPWTEEYEDIKVAHDPAFHRQTFIPYPKAPYVMDAVLATAYALHDILGCKPYKNCRPMMYKLSAPNFRKRFMTYLKKVRFPAMSRHYMSFDEAHDAIGIYDVKHLKLVGNNYEFFNVGQWGTEDCVFDSANVSSSNCLKLNQNLLDNNLMRRNLSENEIPFSRCSPTCSKGYHKITEKNYAKCCWTCRKCTGNSVANITDSDECTPCQRGFWPNSLYSKCERIQPKLIKMTDAPALVILVTIGIGILSVIGTFLVFFLYRDTAVVKASSRELCYLLLLGIFWCYATPVLYLLEPTDEICRIIPFATGLCPSLVVGTLLTKTNRVSRIFNRKLDKAGTPACLSKKWQVLLVVFITLTEIIICSIYIFSSDTGRTVVTFESKNEVIIKCKPMPDIWVAIWWAYVVGLVATCTHQAFLTRKLPENYNEAKFITFTMLTTCIVVIMFIPTYFGTSGVYRTVIICFVFIIGGSAALGCIFVPKLYIILWRPEKNIPMQPKNSISIGIITPKDSIVRRLSVDHYDPLQLRYKITRMNSEPLTSCPDSNENGRSQARLARRSLPALMYRNNQYGPKLGQQTSLGKIEEDRVITEPSVDSDEHSDDEIESSLSLSSSDHDVSDDDDVQMRNTRPRRKTAIALFTETVNSLSNSKRKSISLGSLEHLSENQELIETSKSERNLNSNVRNTIEYLNDTALKKNTKDSTAQSQDSYSTGKICEEKTINDDCDIVSVYPAKLENEANGEENELQSDLTPIHGRQRRTRKISVCHMFQENDTDAKYNFVVECSPAKLSSETTMKNGLTKIPSMISDMLVSGQQRESYDSSGERKTEEFIY